MSVIICDHQFIKKKEQKVILEARTVNFMIIIHNQNILMYIKNTA